MDNYSGQDHLNCSSPITIPLNFGHEFWELLWDHVFDELFHAKEVIRNGSRLIIYDVKELAKPPEAKVALQQSYDS